jgi:hypothetical protein
MGDPVAAECVRHHAVPRKGCFLRPAEMSLSPRGFGAEDAKAAGLLRAKYGVVAKNAGPVSGLAKPFPSGNWRREQRQVRCPTETDLSLAMNAVAEWGRSRRDGHRQEARSFSSGVPWKQWKRGRTRCTYPVKATERANVSPPLRARQADRASCASVSSVVGVLIAPLLPREASSGWLFLPIRPHVRIDSPQLVHTTRRSCGRPHLMRRPTSNQASVATTTLQANTSGRTRRQLSNVKCRPFAPQVASRRSRARR